MARKRKKRGILAAISWAFRRRRAQRPSEGESHSLSGATVNEKFERCIVCGKMTSVPVSLPIDWRENYEVGLGQVCVECARKQRRDAEWGSDLTDEQVLRAVEQSREEAKKK